MHTVRNNDRMRIGLGYYSSNSVYLASPYTGNEQQRYEEVMHAAAYFLKKGMVVFSPIVYGHGMAKQHNLPTQFDFWASLDHRMIDILDEVWVLCISGWEESKGVTDEISYAHSKNKVIRYVHPEEDGEYLVKWSPPQNIIKFN